MHKIIVLIAAAVIALIIYSAWSFYTNVKVSTVLIGQAKPFAKDSDAEGPSLLGLGDSSAVCVGASRPEDSVAGRLSTEIGAVSVENRAVSGAQVHDLAAQISAASRTQYGTILIQIGGNDIVRFHDAARTADALGVLLSTLPKADNVILISAGDVGNAPLFPLILHPFYTHLNKEYHAQFARVAAEHSVLYVNLYTAPGNELFSTDPQTYFAADGFHPSSEGYRVWFDAIRMQL